MRTMRSVVPVSFQAAFCRHDIPLPLRLHESCERTCVGFVEKALFWPVSSVYWILRGSPDIVSHMSVVRVWCCMPANHHLGLCSLRRFIHVAPGDDRHTFSLPVSGTDNRRFNRKIRGKITNSSRQGARGGGAGMGSRVKCVVFTMGKETYGMEIGHVKEILLVPGSIVKMPKAPPAVVGVVNLRGAVIPVADLKKFLGLGQFEAGSESRLLVFFVDGVLFSVLVDAVTEVLDLDEDDIERAGAVLPVWNDGMVRGIGKQEGRLVILLDPGALNRELIDAGMSG